MSNKYGRSNIATFFQAKASGKMLFEQVCKQLNLLETDYFGLEYTDNRGSTYWLDRDKPMNQQVIVIAPVPGPMSTSALLT